MSLEVLRDVLRENEKAINAALEDELDDDRLREGIPVEMWRALR